MFQQKAPGHTNILLRTLLEKSFRVPLTAPFTVIGASTEHGRYPYLRVENNRDIISKKELEQVLD